MIHEANTCYRSVELENIQKDELSAFGLQFLNIPRMVDSIVVSKNVTTRSCDETSNDGSSRLDCIDDED